MREATSAEVSPVGDMVVAAMACSVFGELGTVAIVPETRTQSLYGRYTTREPYRCHYRLNPAYRDLIVSRGLIISGLDADGEVRIVERTDHPFFVATLFVPQLSEEQPHPLLLGFLRAAQDCRHESPR